MERYEVFLGEKGLGNIDDHGGAMTDAIDGHADRTIAAIAASLAGTFAIVEIGVIGAAGDANQVGVKISPAGGIGRSSRRRLSHGSKLGRP